MKFNSLSSNILSSSIQLHTRDVPTNLSSRDFSTVEPYTAADCGCAEIAHFIELYICVHRFVPLTIQQTAWLNPITNATWNILHLTPAPHSANNERLKKGKICLSKPFKSTMRLESRRYRLHTGSWNRPIRRCITETIWCRCAVSIDFQLKVNIKTQLNWCGKTAIQFCFV